MREQQCLVGVDANAMTYLIDAWSVGYDPAEDDAKLATEKTAMLRILLYARHPLCLTQTVAEQYSEISDQSKRCSHWEAHQIILIDGPWDIDLRLRDERVEVLRQFHSDRSDCRIAAEAEQSGFARLLSFDREFASRLDPHLNDTEVVAPSRHWECLAIRRGTTPRIQPHKSNPLSQQRWWRW